MTIRNENDWVLPAVLIEWAPKSNAAPRNLGRPVAGALEVARLGLGGPVPDVLVPVNDAGVERGLGFLPREITVTIGGLVAGATLWIATCLIALAGGLLRSARARLGVFLFAPFVVAAAMLFAPMPFGMLQRPLWDADPALLRAFGPLLVLAGLAACGLALKDVARRLVGRAGRMAEERTDRSPSARAG